VVIGTILDETLGDEIRVTVVATGLPKASAMRAAQPKAGMTLVAAAPTVQVVQQPTMAMPVQQVVNGGSVPAPEQDPYAKYDRPTWERNKEAGSTRRGDTSLLNIPAFLRRQAD